MLNYRVSKEDASLIQAIVDRAHQTWPERAELEISMDITVVHTGYGLRLSELLVADDFNFAHDINGIEQNLDRCSGELKNHFIPRFTVPVAVREEPT